MPLTLDQIDLNPQAPPKPRVFSLSDLDLSGGQQAPQSFSDQMAVQATQAKSMFQAAQARQGNVPIAQPRLPQDPYSSLSQLPTATPEEAQQNEHNARIQQLQNGPMSYPVVGPVLGTAAKLGGTLLGTAARATDLVTGQSNAEGINQQTSDIREAYSNLQGTGVLGAANQAISGVTDAGLLAASGGGSAIGTAAAFGSTTANEAIDTGRKMGLHGAGLTAYVGAKASVMMMLGPALKKMGIGGESDIVDQAMKKAISQFGATTFEVSAINAASKAIDNTARGNPGLSGEDLKESVVNALAFSLAGHAVGMANTGNQPTGEMLEQGLVGKKVVPKGSFKQQLPPGPPVDQPIPPTSPAEINAKAGLDAKGKPVRKETQAGKGPQFNPAPPPRDIRSDILQSNDQQLRQLADTFGVKIAGHGQKWRIAQEDAVQKAMDDFGKPKPTPGQINFGKPNGTTPATTSQAVAQARTPPAESEATSGVPGPPSDQNAINGLPGAANDKLLSQQSEHNDNAEPERTQVLPRIPQPTEQHGPERTPPNAVPAPTGLDGQQPSPLGAPSGAPEQLRPNEPTPVNNPPGGAPPEPPRESVRPAAPESVKSSSGKDPSTDKEFQKGVADVKRRFGVDVKFTAKPETPDATDAESLAKKLGADVAWGDMGDSKVNGFNVRGTNKIVVNAAREGTHLWTIVGHEVAHALGLDKLTDLDKHVVLAAAKRYYNKVSNKQYKQSLFENQDKLMEEGKAVLVGDFLSDPANRAKLSVESPGLWEKIRTAILKVTGNWSPTDETNAKILSALRSAKTERAFQDATEQREQPGSNLQQHQGNGGVGPPTSPGGSGGPPYGGPEPKAGEGQAPPQAPREPVRGAEPPEGPPQGPVGPQEGEDNSLPNGRKLANVGITPEARAYGHAEDVAATAAGEPAPGGTNKEFEAAANARYAADPVAAKAHVMQLDPNEPMSRADTALAKVVKADADDKAAKSGTLEDRIEAGRVRIQYRGTGTEASRAFQQRYDPLRGKSMDDASPDDRMQAMNDAMYSEGSRINKLIKEAQNSGDKDAVNKLLKQQAQQIQDITNKLEKYGLTMEDAQNDPVKTRRFISEYRAMEDGPMGDPAGKTFEVWSNFLFSGIRTKTKKAINDFANGLTRFVVRDNVERAIGQMINDPEAGKLSDAALVIKGIGPGLDEGVKAAWQTMTTGMAQDHDLMGEATGKKPYSIPGKAGQMIRGLGWTQLQAITDMYHTMFSHMDVGAQAAIQGRKLGLSGQDLVNYIQEQHLDPHSEAWMAAQERARADVLTNKLTGFGGRVYKAEQAVRNILPLGVGRFIAPVLGLSVRMTAKGIKDSALGVPINFGEASYQAYKNYRSGKPIASGMSKPLAGVVAAGLGYAAVAGMSTGSNPIIVGNSNVPGRRKRSIMIGGHELDYSGLGAVGLALAINADLARSQSNKSLNDAVEGVVNIPTAEVESQDWLRGVKDLQDLMGLSSQGPNDPSWTQRAKQWSSGFVASWVPNILRNANQAQMDYRGDYKAVGNWSDKTAEAATFRTQAIRYDNWGHAMPANESPFPGAVSDFMYRLCSPLGYSKVDQSDADRELAKWNYENPDDQKKLSEPSANYTTGKGQGKEKHRMTEEQYQQFSRKSGQYAQNYYDSHFHEGYSGTEKAVKVIMAAQAYGKNEARKEINPDAEPEERGVIQEAENQKE